MNRTITILCQFFDREVPRLPTTYNWKIPNIAGFVQSGQSGYLPNLALKRYLKTVWENASTNEEKLQIATTIVSDWGGVRANQPNTLIGYISAISNADPPTPLQGVASYSKIFSIVHPHKFAIYDARVAACLNAVQINAGIKNGQAFNYVPGRNNIVGNVVTKRGFTQNSDFSTGQLVRSGWYPIKRNQTYTNYLELLFSCLEQRPHYSLSSLEMALFANAECECKRAMTSTRLGPTIHCSGYP